MAKGGVIACLLPATSFNLGAVFAPARDMVKAGVPVAMATDFNPGSCPSLNLQLVMNLACWNYRLTPEEVLTAATLNAAAASFERTFPTELQALKVLFQAGSSQSKGTLHWVCSTSDGTQLLSASAPCAASSSMSSPPTRTFASFQALPCFGQYLCFAASGTTGAPPAVVLPAGSGGQNVDASQKLGRLTLTVDTNVRLAAGATIELWGVPA